MSNVTLAGGAVNSNGMFNSQVLTPAATISLDPTAGAIATVVPAQAETINAVNVAVGQVLHVVVTTSGTTSYTLTFGTGFKTTATLATGTADAKTFVLSFVAVGSTLVEVARTAAM